ncbi:EamA family transporter [Sediminispirochaeta smaragdinae]|uniref:EamA domain-containing protein n=1 Tax=Sediminispirochaeta smaragdinae (strain DSM 11293 / JCM 15392 / SEBR 4228) TaxID=573413 RepID=E1RBT5_SEDSS|nr:EamA family transporter [Sediminispirochaeta smaragdinae]ADK79815.1 protein of unknown function DUF6 transmembrane [Sediminispirochaeta smaragdinae DSM 11293]
MKLFILLLLNIIFNSSASFFIKMGTSRMKFENGTGLFALVGHMFTNPFIWTGGICFVIGFLLYSVILQKAELSMVYPIVTSGSLIAITLLSLFVLHEPITLMDFLGFGFILLGIGLIIK